MIRDLFLPATIRGRRYFSEKIVGITLEDWGIRAVVMNITSRGAFLEKAIEQPISGDKSTFGIKTGWNGKPFIEPVKQLIKSIGAHDQLYIAIPSQLAIFKELELPFRQREKIELIIGYEAEPLLPFPLNEAVIDFAISPSQTTSGSHVFVAAWRSIDAQKLAELCSSAAITPTAITLDLFGIHSMLIRQHTNNESTLLLELTHSATKVLLVEHGTPRLARTIPQGLDAFVPLTTTQLPDKDLLQRFKMYGLKPTGDEYYDRTIQAAGEKLLTEIEFTLNSFSTQSSLKPITNVIICEREFPIRDLVERCQARLNIPCQRLTAEMVCTTAKITNNSTLKTSELDPFLSAMGAAFPAPLYAEINLGGEQIRCKDQTLVYRQLKAIGLLFFSLMTALGVHAYSQLTQLSHGAVNTEQTAENLLKKLVPEEITKRRTLTLKKLLENATEEIEKREKNWRQFGCESIPALEALLELTRVMDRNKYDATITQLKIAPSEDGKLALTLEGALSAKNGEPKQEMAELWRQVTSPKLFSTTKPVATTYDDQIKKLTFSSVLIVEQI